MLTLKLLWVSPNSCFPNCIVCVRSTPVNLEEFFYLLHLISLESICPRKSRGADDLQKSLLKQHSSFFLIKWEFSGVGESDPFKLELAFCALFQWQFKQGHLMSLPIPNSRTWNEEWKGEILDHGMRKKNLNWKLRNISEAFLQVSKVV